MKKLEKKRPYCKTCNKHLQLWGKTNKGTQRYRCSSCTKSRIYTKRKKNKKYFFSLFSQYVLWGVTYEMLSEISGYSVRYLEDIFHQLLVEQPPTLSVMSSLGATYLLLDGLWFSRYFVLMVYRKSKELTILHISVAGREVETKITKDLRHIHALGYRFSGIVSDGGTGVVSAIRTVYPHTPHQICLAHIHRDISASVGKYPKDEKVRQLRRLADHVWLIESREALRWWIQQIQEWKMTHWSYYMEIRRDDTGKWWYIHKGVRKALRILLKLPSISFTFLRHPLMPKTTNEIEAQFGHLGKRWLAHRGMKKERWESFMRWFVYFYNQKKLTDRKDEKD